MPGVIKVEDHLFDIVKQEYDAFVANPSLIDEIFVTLANESGQTRLTAYKNIVARDDFDIYFGYAKATIRPRFAVITPASDKEEIAGIGDFINSDDLGTGQFEDFLGSRWHQITTINIVTSNPTDTLLFTELIEYAVMKNRLFLNNLGVQELYMTTDGLTGTRDFGSDDAYLRTISVSTVTYKFVKQVFDDVEDVVPVGDFDTLTQP